MDQCGRDSSLSSVGKLIPSLRSAGLPANASIELLTTGVSATELDPVSGGIPRRGSHRRERPDELGMDLLPPRDDVVKSGVRSAWAESTARSPGLSAHLLAIGVSVARAPPVLVSMFHVKRSQRRRENVVRSDRRLRRRCGKEKGNAFG